MVDLDTGTSVITRGLAEHGANIIGVDIASEQIEQAEKLSEKYKKITYIASPVEDCTFANNAFDTITACQCFWYFDPKRIVAKIKQMIKANGLFLSFTWAAERRHDCQGIASACKAAKSELGWRLTDGRRSKIALF